MLWLGPLEGPCKALPVVHCRRSRTGQLLVDLPEHPCVRTSWLVLVLLQASPLAVGPCTPPSSPHVCAAGSAGPRRQHAEAGPPARAAQQQGILAFVVNLPLDVVRLGLRLVAGVFNLGASLVSLLGQRLLPGPIYHMFAGGAHCRTV